MRKLIFLLLFPIVLFAQRQTVEKPVLNFNTTLGTDPVSQIHLVTPGCWNGLMMATTGTVLTSNLPNKKSNSHLHRIPEATVEVRDFLFEEPIDKQTFRLFMKDLLLCIKQNWQFAPATHGQIDAAIRANGGGTDMAMVQSLQQRFNRLPPNGSPVKPE
jgi:hypothetical protein